jgi:hypothetical protein
MLFHRTLFVFANVISSTAALAGPCSSEVERVQARIDAYLEAKADAGPRARQSSIALLHHQPTAASMAAIEERLGELDASGFETFALSMAIARASNRIGDRGACERALGNAEGAIILMMQSDESKTRNEPSKRKS